MRPVPFFLLASWRPLDPRLLIYSAVIWRDLHLEVLNSVECLTRTGSCGMHNSPLHCAFHSDLMDFKVMFVPAQLSTDASCSCHCPQSFRSVLMGCTYSIPPSHLSASVGKKKLVHVIPLPAPSPSIFSSCQPPPSWASVTSLKGSKIMAVAFRRCC